MQKARTTVLTLAWMLLAAIPASFAHAQPASTSSWRIRYHEPLPPMRLETTARASADAPLPLVTRMSFVAMGRIFELDLESNDRLIAQLGQAEREALGSDLRLYRGSVVGAEDSWVRLTRSHDRWAGTIWDGFELYVVDPVDAVAEAIDVGPGAGEGGNIIYRMSDSEDLVPVRCGLDSETDGAGGVTDAYSALREHLDPLGPIMAMAQSQEAIEIVVVADAEFVAENGASTALAVASRVNVVDGIFDSQVGVALSLVEIVELASNGSLSSTNASQLLNQFSDLSFSGGIENPGLAHLFTARNLDGSTAGIAFLRGICRVSTGVAVSETRGAGTRGAITVAHEIGHNFGAPHDNESGSPCAATPSGFLMNPSLNFGGDEFSQCSLDEIEPIVDRANCLVPVPEPDAVSMQVAGLLSVAWLARLRNRRSANRTLHFEGSPVSVAARFPRRWRSPTSTA